MTIYYKADDEIKKLYNFNENYLGHSFIISENFKLMDLIIKCVNCNLKGYYTNHYNDYEYSYITKSGNCLLDLTCEEQQIKNLLE